VAEGGQAAHQSTVRGGVPVAPRAVTDNPKITMRKCPAIGSSSDRELRHAPARDS
jgi:hypothetical protein